MRDAQTNLSRKNIGLWVDGKRVRAFSYDRATDRLSSVPKRRMNPGRHTVLIVVRDGKGLSESRFWSFSVRKR